MNRRDFLSATLSIASPPAPRPNVLLIVIDDCAPDVVSLNEARAVPTPNMARLARRGAVFSNAYCAAPACGPSRSALLTGIHPSVSGVYQNDQSFRKGPEWLRRVVTLPGRLKSEGYLTAGYGKVFHSGEQSDVNRQVWTEGHYYPLSVEEDHAAGRHVPAGEHVRGSNEGEWTWGPLPDDFDRADERKMLQDTRNAGRAARLVSQPQAAPFFCALGLYRPHVSWYVARRYYDRFPLDSIQPPQGLLWDDLDDLPPAAHWFRQSPVFRDIQERGLWKRALQAKYASISYADEQIGRVLDALDNGPHRANTYVVVAGDNGWHTGQKRRFSKFALWELACRVPLIVAGPGIATGLRRTPVSLLDLYPTLLALSGAARPAHSLGGVDLTPVLRRQQASRGKPVLTTMGANNHSLRTDRFRYIRYSNGDEELYDHEADPHEWINLAPKPEHAALKERLARLLPEHNAPELYESGWTRRWSEYRKSADDLQGNKTRP